MNRQQDRLPAALNGSPIPADGDVAGELSLLLDWLHLAIFVVDGSLRLLWVNQSARRLLTRGDRLRVNNGGLTANGESQTGQLAEAVRKAVNPTTAPQAVSLSWSDRRHSLLVLVRPFPQPVGAAVLLATDPRSIEECDVETLRQWFGLTPAEARVAVALSQGESIAEIAGRCSLAVETVRNHVKKVLSKTGTSRQGELVSMLLRSPAHWCAPGRPIAPDPPEER